MQAKIHVDYNYRCINNVIKGKVPKGEYGILGRQVTLESFDPGETKVFKRYPCKVLVLKGTITLDVNSNKIMLCEGESLLITNFKICPLLLHKDKSKKIRCLILVIRFPNTSKV